MRAFRFFLGLLLAAGCLCAPHLALASVVACGNGPCVQHPPYAIQQTVIFASTSSVTATPPLTAGTGADHYLLCIAMDVNHTTVTPTGYTQLGQTLESTVQVTIYYRSPPTGNSSDNCVFSDSSASAKSLMLIELGNAGTPAGYAGTSATSANTFTTASVTSSPNDLLFSVFVPVGAIAPSSGSAPWSSTALVSGTSGSVATVMSYAPFLSGTYVSTANLAVAVAAADCIFRVPSYGY